MVRETFVDISAHTDIQPSIFLTLDDVDEEHKLMSPLLPAYRQAGTTELPRHIK